MLFIVNAKHHYYQFLLQNTHKKYPFLLFKYGMDTLRNSTDVNPQPPQLHPGYHYYVLFLFGITSNRLYFSMKFKSGNTNELR